MTLDQMEKVLPPNLSRWTRELYGAATMYGLDPLILAAIMQRESRGGDSLLPLGPTGTGDGGHGRGLMQIDDRWHQPFISTGLWKYPALNVTYAARLVHISLEALGTYPAALGAYNAGPTRIRQILAACPPRSTEEQCIKAMDTVTTNKYVAGVLDIYKGLVRKLAE